MLSLIYSSDNNKHFRDFVDMEAIDIEHDLVVVEEFDALSIEVGVAELEAKADEIVRRYPAKQNARRVAKELGVEDGIIFLLGQLESTWEDSDQGPPFRQRRYFYYMSGINFPGCSVTYDIAADKLTLWIPCTTPATVLWFGETPSLDDCLARSDVHDVKDIKELPAYLSARLATVKALYALRQSQLPKFDGFEQMRPSLKVDTTSLQPAMDEARLIKSDYEIAMIRRANDVSSAAHRKVAALVSTMKHEYDAQAIFISACTAAGAKALAYPVMAGSGSNASTLHYDANSGPLAGRQLLVFDAGAEWSCYASDVTRTIPLGSRYRFSAEARAIYDLVHRIQDECIKRIKPGVVFRDLQLHATFMAVQGLLELGILCNGTAEEIFKNGTGAAFFPHGLGHHIGLDVHDVLSRDLLRPAGDGMWGKRRPIGPQSVRAMIKQAANEATPATPAPPSPTSTIASIAQEPSQPSPPSPAQSIRPPLPPRSPPSQTQVVITNVTAASPPPASLASTPPKNGIASNNNNTKTKPQPQPRPQTPPRTRSPAQTRTQSQSQSQSPPPPAPLPPLPPTPTRSPQRKPSTSPTGAKKKSKRAAHGALQPNMVVTVEPGVYFCRPYVEAYFLRRPEQARYVDAGVLERYWSVGGARVEDCVLVGQDGCEVLTTAPKGDELLRMMGFA